MRALVFGVVGVLSVAVSATTVSAQYLVRASVNASGAVTFTGNTLGLAKATNTNGPGTNGSIGTFITTDTSLQDGPLWPFGTTGDWHLNRSAAVLQLPPGSTVLYAELVWSGSYAYGGENVFANLNDPVSFMTPGSSALITPDPATARTLGALTGTGSCQAGAPCFYVRTANVTPLVQAGGAGTYSLGGVPATQGATENNSNAAGWTLAVLYEDFSQPTRNMTLFTGSERDGAPPAPVAGFCTPPTGPVAGRIAVTALEGDAAGVGARLLFGPTATLTNANSLVGPRNPANNFFASQITGNDGQLDTTGTFGTANSTSGSTTSGARQGWDITNVDGSAQLVNGQTQAFAQGITTGDQYLITALGLQIDIGAPEFAASAKSVDRLTAAVGDVLTYTIVLNNSGVIDATNVVFSDAPPAGTAFVVGSFRKNGTVVAGANSASGVPLGTVGAGAAVTVTFQARVVAPPAPPASAILSNGAAWTYQYQSCAGQPLTPGLFETNTVTTQLARLSATKNVAPTTGSPGQPLTFTIAVTNAGATAAMGVTLTDMVPPDTTYVPSSARLNGAPVSDIAGAMPFASGGLLNGTGDAPGQISVGATATVMFDVIVGPNAAGTVVNTALIDPDGPGGGMLLTPSAGASIIRPTADVAVAVAFDRPTANVGESVTFTVQAANQGPNPVSGLELLDITPPGLAFISAVPSQGAYDQATGVWTAGALANTASATLMLTMRVVTPGTITKTATKLAADQDDSNAANNSAAAALTSNPVADLRLLKTGDGVVKNVGDTATFTIAVENSGPNSATGVRINDLLPAGLAFQSATPSAGSYDPLTGAWTVDTLTAGGSATLIVTAIVVQAGQHTNVATIAGLSELDPTSLNDGSGVTINGQAADIQVLKLVRSRVPGVATVGERIQYAILISNQGPNSATDLLIQDILPAELAFAGALASQGAYVPATGIWQVGTLAPAGPSSTATLEIDADVVQAAVIRNVAARLGADQVDTNPQNDQAEAAITSLESDLAIDVSVTGNPSVAGSQLDVVATLTSVGLGAVSGPLVVTFVLPDGVAYESGPPGWTCTPTGRVVSCTRTDLVLARNVSEVLRIVTRVISPTSGVLVHASVADSGDANSSNNVDEAALASPPPLTADVTVATTVSAATAFPAQPFTLGATVGNAGPSSSGPAVLVVGLPAGVAVDSVQPSTGSCVIGSPLSCDVGTLAPGSSMQVTIQLHAVSPGVVIATASATGTAADPELTNNQSAASIAISAPVDADTDGMSDICESLFGLSVGTNDSGGDPDADTATNIVECAAGTHPRGFFKRYFAEGASGGGFFSANFTAVNPDLVSPASWSLQLFRDDGVPIAGEGQLVPPSARADWNVQEILGDAPQVFSAIIESDRPVSAERTMRWDASTYGSHSEAGLEAPATEWHLAEGSTTVFDLYYLILNPTTSDAQVEVKYLLPNGPPVVRTYDVRANSRFTIWLNLVPGLESTDVAAIVTSLNGVPIVVERTMYLSSGGRLYQAGHAGAGIKAPAVIWHLAEGATGEFFDTFVLVSNPDTQPATFDATFRKPDGTALVKSYEVGPQARFNIWVDLIPELADTAVATTITATSGVPLVVERAMWWPGPSQAALLGTPIWSEAHVVAASPIVGPRWAVADGEAGGPLGHETYILVANTSATAGLVQVSILFDDGSHLARNFEIAGSARLTVPVGLAFPETLGRRFSAVVESAGAVPLDLVVERATYSNSAGVLWAAGVAVMGTPLP